MKKQLLVVMAIAVSVSGTVFAQSKSVQNPGGIYLKGGFNLSNISTKTNGSVENAKTLPTFQVGAIADIPLAPVFSLQTGLMLNGKGSKTQIFLDNANHADNYYNVKTNPFYLELPVNAVLKLPVAEKARIYVGAGPYAAVGLFGKITGNSKIGGVETSFDKKHQV